MALQVYRAGDAEFGHYIKALVCGDPGSGKTRFGSTCPNVFYANAEGGLMSVQDRRPAAANITSVGDMRELYMALKQNPDVRANMLGVPVETLVLDTIDELARIYVKERLRETNSDTMKIADWGWLGDQLRTLVRALRNLDMNVILTCHLKSVKDEETGRVFFAPAIPGAMGDEIPGYVDVAGVLKSSSPMEIVNGKNVCVTRRHLQLFADQNHPWVKDRSGRLPLEFPINLNDDFTRMHDLI